MAAMFSTRPRRNEEFCGEHHLHHLQLVKYIIGLVVSEEKISKSETRLSNGGPDFVKQKKYQQH